MRGIRSKLTYANVVSTLCLFLLLGGGAYAASQINGRNLKNRSVSGAKIKRNGLTGTEIKESRLGKVPKAVDADTLGGQAPSSYRLQCPTGLNQAADVCYEPTTRPPATFEVALATCARAQRRIPSVSELALVFDHGAASQPPEWTATAFTDYAPATPRPLATILSQNVSRQLTSGNVERSFPVRFRCVTSPSN